jgi:Ni/Co efflux regulator RcnB
MNGRSMTACALALAFLALSGKVAIAQDRGQDRRPGGEASGGDNRQGGQRQDPQAQQGKQSFNDQDRQATQEWYRQHQRNAGRGWRQQDRLPPGLQGRLRAGQRLDPQLRRRMYPLPPDLARRYGPAPRGYRYVIIGGNVVLIDDGYQVRDLFSITLHF